MKDTIKLIDVNKSLLLQEVTRAYLHSGTPSALLYRMSEGIRENIAECESEADKKLYQEFLDYIRSAQKVWRDREDVFFNPPTRKETDEEYRDRLIKCDGVNQYWAEDIGSFSGDDLDRAGDVFECKRKDIPIT